MSSRRRPILRGIWPIIIILSAAVLTIVFVQRTDRIEGIFKFHWMLGAVVLAVLSLNGILLFGRLSRSLKLLGVVAQLLFVVGGAVLAHNFLKRHGSFPDTGVPRYVWRSTPPRDALLASVSITSDANPVDLQPTNSDWPQFLGPHRDNSVEDVGLSSDWTSHQPRELWRRTIGAGWGSFAIVNGFAITQEQRGGQEIVTCMEARTGTVRWQHANATRFHESMGGDGPRATPTIADGCVYVMGATGILDCLQGASGTAIWSRNVLGDAHANNLNWGKSCSPMVIGRLVIVTGGDAGPSVLAYDRQSGAPVWQSGTDQSAYSSPALATVGGARELLIVNAHSVTGCAVEHGGISWSFPWPGDWPKVSQPVKFDGDRIFISAGYGLGCAMLHVDTDPSGVQSVKQVWSHRKLKTEFTNVAVNDGFIYGLDDGVLTCLDSANGARRWRDGRYGHGQILRVDDLLIVQAEAGDVALVAAAPDKFCEFATLPALKSQTWNNPALSGHLLLLRNDREAVCYELP